MNKDIRRRIVEKGNELNFGHYCSAMSCVDIVAYLYKHVLTDDDVFIMSKGHGIIACLPLLEKKHPNIKWHPYLDYNPEWEIEATTASLGHGLPIAVGRAFGKKIQNKPGYVYVMVGDGDMQEGSNWEALNIARRLELDNLVILVDFNYYQAVSSVWDIMRSTPEDLYLKMKSFGCRTLIMDGHSEKDLSIIKAAKFNMMSGIKTFILKTQKGKGIKYLEDNPSFHVFYFKEHPEILKQTLEDLK